MESTKYPEGALVFVWNADAGWQHALMDSLHKVLSPQTYSCKLCQLTYGVTGPKTRWSRFLKTIGRPVEFYHRDEFRETPMAQELPGLELPAVLVHKGGKWQLFLSRSEISQFQDLEALLAELNKKISGAA